MGKILFAPAKHQKLAEVITIVSPTAARNSVPTLKSMFRNAMSREKKMYIARGVRLAANRAEASRKNPRISGTEKKQMADVAEVYSRLATSMFLQLRRR